MEVLPSDTYRVAELDTDGREIYATTTHVSQLKSWSVLRAGNNDSDEEGSETEDGGKDQLREDDNHEEGRAELTVSTQSSRDDTGQKRVTRARRAPKYLDDFTT